MADQERIAECDRNDDIAFILNGCSYNIIKDTSRGDRPSWYVQRMRDMRSTERHYNHPDGAFSAVYWERCNWVD